MSGRGRSIWKVALLVCVTAAAYLPALRAGFIWDDDTFLTQNRLIRAADGLRRFWFTTQAPDYFPVTYTPLWVEWRLWGMHAAGYHAVNLGLHIAAALLLWAVLSRLRAPAAWLAAFLFAVHPMNVESVAWITQRKNLMALVLLLGSAWFFPLARPSSEDRVGETDAGRILPSLLLFTLAMLAKGSVAMFPFMLLGLVAWRRPPSARDIARLVPFLLVSAALVLVDIWFQKHGSSEVFRGAGPVERLLGAGGVVWFYLGKALLPIHLLFVYPAWHVTPANPAWWMPLLAAAILTAMLWRHRNGPARPVLFAWGYCVLALVPVMGFTDVQFMQYSLVADHYGQLALIGVVALAAAVWSRWRDRAGGAGLLPRLVAAATVATLALLTSLQAGSYRDAETLYRATLAGNPDCWLAENNLGGVLQRSGRVAEAIGHYESALRLKPDLFEARNDLGLALASVGRLGEAVDNFDAALRIHPDNAAVHYNRATALVATGRLDEAVASYGRALALRPGFAEAEHDLGAALTQLGRLPEAVPHYREALRLKPGYFEARANLGTVLVRLGDPAGAAEQFAAASLLRPGNETTRFNFGCALAQLGRTAEAAAQFEEVLRLDPGNAQARANLARLSPGRP
jgi:tetratricopeptide (TPR) repeat protein